MAAARIRKNGVVELIYHNKEKQCNECKEFVPDFDMATEVLCDPCTEKVPNVGN